MNKNKEKIRKKIVDFVKREYRKCGIVPSIKKINMEFNIYFRFYFPDGMSKLYKLSGFKFSPQQNRQRSIKRQYRETQELKRKKIIDFAKKKYKKSDVVPSCQVQGRRTKSPPLNQELLIKNYLDLLRLQFNCK